MNPALIASAFGVSLATFLAFALICSIIADLDLGRSASVFGILLGAYTASFVLRATQAQD